jgi:hypothetical protein
MFCLPAFSTHHPSLGTQVNPRGPGEPQHATAPASPRDEDFRDPSMAQPGKDAAAHRRHRYDFSLDPDLEPELSGDEDVGKGSAAPRRRKRARKAAEEGAMARPAEMMRVWHSVGEQAGACCPAGQLMLMCVGVRLAIPPVMCAHVTCRLACKEWGATTVVGSQCLGLDVNDTNHP